MSLNSVDMLQVSDNPEWATPQYVFDQLDREFHFTLDVCADDSNHKCERYFTKEDDGLSHDWTGERCWMNPPYGKAIGAWAKKAADSAEKEGTIVVGLVPCRTDTRWWQENVMRADEIRFVKGRLKFGKAGMGAPFANAIIVWAGRETGDCNPIATTIEFKEGKE